MSLALTSKSTQQRNDPTGSLRQALTDFETILSLDERMRLHAAAAPSDVSSVLDFVGQLDSNNRSRAGRCVAQRLCRFLESIQQFTGVIGSFVSSNPNIAGLVWGGVRLTILTASNIASFFDKVTDMIMKISKSAPTYRQFGSLYPAHVGIQQALCGYYTIIVRMCTRIVNISKRNALAHTVTSIFTPFDAEFKDLLEDLTNASGVIQLQASLASKQVIQDMKTLQEFDAKQNRRHHNIVMKFQESARNEHSEAQIWRLEQRARELHSLRTSIKDDLSPIDHLRPWKQATRQMVIGTAGWIFSEPDFINWRSSTTSGLLWCTGRMGTGKTILTSHVVAHLHATRQENEIISFFFCQSERLDSLSARGIIGSLTRQLLGYQIDTLAEAELHAMKQETKTADVEEILKLLFSSLTKDKKLYIVLDGLDECGAAELRSLLKSLGRVVQTFPDNIKLFCASRLELELHLDTVLMPHYHIAFPQDLVGKDIAFAAAQIVQDQLSEGTLKLGDHSLVAEVCQTLQEQSEGNFLWMMLVLDELCLRSSDHEILEALHDLPRGLSKLLYRKLSRIQLDHENSNELKLLEYCCVLRESLTLAELQEVLSLCPGQLSMDRRRFPNDMLLMVKHCAGLLFVDEEDLTVHFVHHSIQTYLLTEGSFFLRHSDLQHAHRHFGVLCMTYLDFVDLKGHLSKTKQPHSHVIDAVDLAIGSSGLSARPATKLAKWLLSRKQGTSGALTVGLEATMERMMTDFVHERLKTAGDKSHHFLRYANTHWIYHVASLTQSNYDEQAWKLFVKMMANHDNLFEWPWHAEAQRLAGDDVSHTWSLSCVRWAWRYEHVGVLAHAFKSNSSLSFREAKVCIALLAASRSNEGLLDSLLQVSFYGQAELDIAIMLAAWQGKDQHIVKLINAGGNPNRQAKTLNFRWLSGRPSLAPSAVYPPLCRDLELQLSEDVRASMHCWYYAIQVAAMANRPSCIATLLINGASTGGEPGVIALYSAAEWGHLKCLSMILANGVDVNAFARNGWTSLQIAASLSRTHIVEALIEAGADLYRSAFYSHTPLELSINQQLAPVVKCILEADSRRNPKSISSIKALAATWKLDNVAREKIIAYARKRHSDQPPDQALQAPDNLGSELSSKLYDRSGRTEHRSKSF